jgi:hypothetical protein
MGFYDHYKRVKRIRAKRENEKWLADWHEKNDKKATPGKRKRTYTTGVKPQIKKKPRPKSPAAGNPHMNEVIQRRPAVDTQKFPE